VLLRRCCGACFSWSSWGKAGLGLGCSQLPAHHLLALPSTPACSGAPRAQPSTPLRRAASASLPPPLMVAFRATLSPFQALTRRVTSALQPGSAVNNLSGGPVLPVATGCFDRHLLAAACSLVTLAVGATWRALAPPRNRVSIRACYMPGRPAGEGGRDCSTPGYSCRPKGASVVLPVVEISGNSSGSGREHHDRRTCKPIRNKLRFEPDMWDLAGRRGKTTAMHVLAAVAAPPAEPSQADPLFSRGPSARKALPGTPLAQGPTPPRPAPPSCCRPAPP
jgi:hypothetical protein